MKKIIFTWILLLLVGLAACQPVSAPAQQLPSQTPDNTSTPLPPKPTVIPTETPIPPLNSPNGPPLRSIHMFTLKDGWGLMDDQLLVTHDGGGNWASVPLPVGKVDSATEAVFVNMTTVHLVVPSADGKSGQYLITHDGGANWEVHPVPFVRGDLVVLAYATYFLERGGDSGQNVSIYRNTNGIDWVNVVSITLPDTKLLTGFSFNGIENGWLGLASQPKKVVLYRTTSSAQDWALQEIPTPENMDALTTSVMPPVFSVENSPTGILPVDFTTTATGERNRVFYVTTDGGNTWLPGGTVPEGGVYAFLDENIGWAWGKRGLYGTTDGAQTWQLLPGGFNRTESASWINFVDPQNGWLLTVGQNSRVRIYRTSDGGNSWLLMAP